MGSKKMAHAVINLKEKLAQIAEQWSPKIVAELNDYHLKLVKLQGDFVWHSHPDTDEAFLVLAGEMAIDFRDGTAKLGTGELLVVPKGVEHKPRAEEECHALLIEPAGTPNTGDAGGDRTVENPDWI
jgi:mannose-6-phosphate isomerase-like protein (cupin superfamily)